MRTADKADPDPEVTTALFYIWPLMLVSGLKTKYFNKRFPYKSGGNPKMYMSTSSYTNMLLESKAKQPPLY